MLKGMINIVFANIIVLLTNVITNFILPKYLSVESYAMLRTFSLYTTYIGMLHFGYVDGIYIKYGGKIYEEINTEELQESVSTLRIFQFVITVVLIGTSIIAKDKILLAFSVVILPRNMAGFFKMIFQATGQFEKYSILLNLSTILSFISNIILLFLVRTDQFIWYLIAYIVVDFTIYFVMELFLYKTTGRVRYLIFSYSRLEENIKQGILVMLGNLSSFILVGMDRWFVKVFMRISDFAEYSFAASIENMLNLFVTPITITLYNYFCVKSVEKAIKTVRIGLYFIGFIITVLFFPIKYIVERYLYHYQESVNVIVLLFAAQYIGLFVKGIYVNLYKARKKQKVYFIKLLIVVATAFILNGLFFSLIHQKEAFAVGTLISVFIWLLISIPDFKEAYWKPKEIIYIFLVCIIFIMCGIRLNFIVGGIVYTGITILLMKILIGNSIIMVFTETMKRLTKNDTSR